MVIAECRFARSPADRGRDPPSTGRRRALSAHRPCRFPSVVPKDPWVIAGSRTAHVSLQGGDANSPESHADSYEGRANLHGGCAHLHGGHANLHGGRANLHEGRANSHGGRANLHGGHANLHGGHANSHEAHVNLHGGHVSLHGGHANLHGGRADWPSNGVTVVTRTTYDISPRCGPPVRRD